MRSYSSGFRPWEAIRSGVILMSFGIMSVRYLEGRCGRAALAQAGSDAAQ
jgi:hypothetical protein